MLTRLKKLCDRMRVTGVKEQREKEQNGGIRQKSVTEGKESVTG